MLVYTTHTKIQEGEPNKKEKKKHTKKHEEKINKKRKQKQKQTLFYSVNAIQKLYPM